MWLKIFLTANTTLISGSERLTECEWLERWENFSANYIKIQLADTKSPLLIVNLQQWISSCLAILNVGSVLVMLK